MVLFQFSNLGGLKNAAEIRQLQVECCKCDECTEEHDIIPAGCTGVSFIKELSLKCNLEE